MSTALDAILSKSQACYSTTKTRRDVLRTRNMGTAAAIALLIGLSGLSVAGPPRQMEKIDRGVVAVSTPEGKVHFG